MLKKLAFILVYGTALLTVYPVAYICSAIYWASKAGWYAGETSLLAGLQASRKEKPISKKY